ncbi:hypothetical protein [Belnapia rosea]|uniref:Uncharacterized protein n=1 Tax=Belnapia rosea TaxID=938405 RepID=A0A1G6Q003_9PROT|nr:hypothetical protein [Belnapia rosea]SDB57929.1 hypothetical protein SAMN02927895_02287 [Belnapia rosea]SDC84967.1 hypothetical protein SAMN04487779_1002560 [Belnapia rosea]
MGNRSGLARLAYARLGLGVRGRITLRTDKGYDMRDDGAGLRGRRVTSHIARNGHTSG